MADPHEAKEENIPIASPATPPPTPPVSPGKETARINFPSRPPAPLRPPSSLGKGKPLPPAGILRTATKPVANPPAPELVQLVSTRLCWTLLGISALSLLIQLWTYFS